MPQLPLIGELRPPHRLVITLEDVPDAASPTTNVIAVVYDRRRSVLAAASTTLSGLANDCIATITEAVVNAYLYGEAAHVERALLQGGREAKSHAQKHEA